MILPKQTRRWISLAAVILLFSTACSRPPRQTNQLPRRDALLAQILTGRVVRVADGDTVTVSGGKDHPRWERR